MVLVMVLQKYKGVPKMKDENELTDDELQKELNKPYTTYGANYVKDLIRALLAERAKPKIWDGSKDDELEANVYFCKGGSYPITGTRLIKYIRKPQKTIEQEIAEKYAEIFRHGVFNGYNNELLSMLKEYAEAIKKE
jgi:hypothetical protein